MKYKSLILMEIERHKASTDYKSDVLTFNFRTQCLTSIISSYLYRQYIFILYIQMCFLSSKTGF